MFEDKTRFIDGEPGDGDINSNPEEVDAAGPSPAVRPLQSDDPGIHTVKYWALIIQLRFVLKNQ